MNDNFRVVDADRFRVPGIPWRAVGAGVLALAALVTAAGAAYQIEPEEVGVVLRFGRYVRTSEPGLHFKIPFVEAMQRVPVQRQLKQEFGFRTTAAGLRTEYAGQQQELAAVGQSQVRGEPASAFVPRRQPRSSQVRPSAG